MAIVLQACRSCAFQVSKTIPIVGQKQLLSNTRLPFISSDTGMAGQVRNAFRQATASTRRTIKERLMAPSQGTAISLGQGLVIGSSGLGLGCLCYYGLGFASQPGALEKSMIWPQYVKDRIKTTYAYFGSSIAVSVASAVACSRSPAFMRLITKNSWLVMGGTIVAMIGSGMVVRSIQYTEGIGAKQFAWATHCGVLGAVVAPLCFLGGPLLTRAAWYTAGIVGSLSALAVCAPSEKFLNMGGPLACGLGLVFASSLGSMFLPPTTALGVGLYSISMYGGLVLFSAFLLYDTQRIIHAAEAYPLYAVRPYDPINASISIYLDTFNIFIRIAMLLAGGGSRRK